LLAIRHHTSRRTSISCLAIRSACASFAAAASAAEITGGSALEAPLPPAGVGPLRLAPVEVFAAAEELLTAAGAAEAGLSEAVFVLVSGFLIFLVSSWVKAPNKLVS
jgi:hypothetical protein